MIDGALGRQDEEEKGGRLQMTWVILRASIETDKHKCLDDKKLDDR